MDATGTLHPPLASFGFGGSMLGLLLRRVLPEDYFDESTQTVVQIVMGTISVITALVISLALSQACNTLSSREQQVEQLATYLLVLDRELLQLGADAQEIRGLVRQYTTLKIDITWPKNGRASQFDNPEMLHLLEKVQNRLMSPAAAE